MLPVWLPIWQILGSSDNVIPFVFTAFFLFTLTAFILRNQIFSMDAASCVMVAPQPAEFSVQYHPNSFQIDLKEAIPGDDHKQNLKSGIKAIITSAKPYWFVYFWGCDIASFHQTVARDWRDLRKDIIDGKLLEGKYLESSKSDLSFESQKEYHLKSAKNLSEEDLGESPRSRFPLVTVMVLHEESDSEVYPTETVALLSAIHVQDNMCPSESNFVFKLSKIANGQVLNVSTLFTRDNNEDASICLVCESERVTIGLLPCRHFSLCEHCYNRLEIPKRCPICRSYVTRYFKHRLENDQVPISSNDEPPPTTETTNDRPNLFRRLFGF